WGGIYGLLPRLTGREPSTLLAGVHFWFALVGLTLYSVALMIGGTLQGYSWMSDVPFMRSVMLMEPFYLWRAVGGMLMFISHVIFAWNIWCMRPQRQAQEGAAAREDAAARSEEHTSELQSRFELVCRLLLEKTSRHQHA